MIRITIEEIPFEPFVIEYQTNVHGSFALIQEQYAKIWRFRSVDYFGLTIDRPFAEFCNIELFKLHVFLELLKHEKTKNSDLREMADRFLEKLLKKAKQTSN